jgi:hypothetical protein
MERIDNIASNYPEFKAAPDASFSGSKASDPFDMLEISKD